MQPRPLQQLRVQCMQIASSSPNISQMNKKKAVIVVSFTFVIFKRTQQIKQSHKRLAAEA
jgi:hypothetical protein